MATLTITGTADQLRRIAALLEAAADAGTNPRSVTVTIDNTTAGSTGLTGPDGKRKDG